MSNFNDVVHPPPQIYIYICRYDADTTDIKFHGANLAPAYPRFKRNGAGNLLCQCDFAIYGPDEAQPKISTLTYTLYYIPVSTCGSDFRRVFSERAALEAVDKLSSLDGLLQYGEAVTGDQDANEDRMFGRDSSPGSGVVFNVLVNDVGAYNIAVANSPDPSNPVGINPKDYMAVYTPSATYACNLEPGLNCSAVYKDETACNENSACTWIEADKLDPAHPSRCALKSGALACNNLVSTLETVLCGSMLLLGIAMAFAGLRYFKASLLLNGFLLFTGIVYIIVAKTTQGKMDYSAQLGISVGSGLAGSVLLLALWYYKNSASAALVTVGLVKGWVIASFVFATPLGTFAMWKNRFNFIMCFLCVVRRHPTGI